MTQIPALNTRDARRLCATAALILASSLQICGCNPVPDCRRILELQLSSLDSEALRERCAQCVTAQQMRSLDRRSPASSPGRLLLAGAAALRSEATIQQALLGEEGSSFYDPAVHSGIDTENGPGSEAAPGDLASPLRTVTSSEAGFTPWPIPESVFFIYRSAEAGEERVPIATAFILSVPGVNHRILARFLVLPRHVVDPEWAHCSTQNPGSVEVGFNRRGGGVGFETIALTDAHRRRYFVPSGGTSDIAIVRLDEQLVPDLESYKFVDTPFRLLPTEADLHAIAGALQIVTASVPARAQAGLNAFPVSGHGVLSSTMSEPVDIHCGSDPAARSLSVWFIGGSVQQGASGAPVYASRVRAGETTPTTVLLGVQAIAWPDRGLAAITPSTALADLVQTALAGQRARADFSRGVTPYMYRPGMEWGESPWLGIGLPHRGVVSPPPLLE